MHGGIPRNDAAYLQLNESMANKFMPLNSEMLEASLFSVYPKTLTRLFNVESCFQVKGIKT